MKYPLFLACLLLAACASHNVGGSYVGDLTNKTATDAIANDAAIYLSEEYAPGHTTLHLLMPEKDNDFSISLDNALRARGFTLAPDSSGDAITVGYTLDGLEDTEAGGNGALYLQLRLSDGQTAARVYGPDGVPEAGRSSAHIEKPLFQLKLPQRKTGPQNPVPEYSGESLS